jgi:hypothetical protein
MKEMWKVAKVQGIGGELVPLEWIRTGAGVSMAHASAGDLTLAQFEREVRRLFPRRASYEFKVADGGEMEAVVR